MEIYTNFDGMSKYTRLVLSTSDQMFRRSIAIFNIDGILREAEAREARFLGGAQYSRNFNGYYDSAKKAPKIKAGVKLLEEVRKDGHEIFIVSGFPDSRLFEACQWLQKHDLLKHITEIWFKNSLHSNMGGVEFKLACYNAIQADGRIQVCYDDNERLKRAVENSGYQFKVLNVKGE